MSASPPSASEIALRSSLEFRGSNSLAGISQPYWSSGSVAFVPRDVSVTGFDDIELAKFCYPPLTTVHIPRDEIGHPVFRSLARDDKTKEVVGREFAIAPELVVRDSTGPAGRVG